MAELIGKDFTPPDIRAKVTGAAKYAEDFRMDGMLFCRLLKSPMPHAAVRSIDARTALAMDGVVAILTADDVPEQPAPGNSILTNEPLFVGDPILAVAAVDEETAQNAIDAIVLDLEPLPFCTDPLDSLRPDGPNARRDGNTFSRDEGVFEQKWSTDDFLDSSDSEMPRGAPGAEWTYGDLDAGFAAADLVLDESFVTASTAHHSMEPRTAFSYWQGGKCFVHGSTQSQSIVHPGLANYIGIPPEDLVFVSEFCGGGFGSKAGSLSDHVDPGAYVEKDPTSRHDAD